MSIQVHRLTKSFGNQVVVNQVSFEVARGECFVLLGPSGSGKSTVLRMIAGLTAPDAGQIGIDGRDVGQLAPQKRDIGFVFQQYALFGHMTVADNVEFALRVRHVPSGRRRLRRGELLELVGLAGLDRRYPHQLSGGQQQRVALARALAHGPRVLLLDEPFGALDARIRTELRRTLSSIQRELGVTTLFVTHDQEEAFELADHLGVMNFGNLLEVGPPEELYLRPRTEFTATFLGRANLFVGESHDGGLSVGPWRLQDLPGRAGWSRQRVQVLFRPEDVAVKTSPDALAGPALGEGVVEAASFVGSVERLRVRLPAIRGVRAIAPAAPFGSDHAWVEAQRSQHLATRYPVRVGDRVHVGVRRVHALAHPGLSYLVALTVEDATPARLGQIGHLARQTHARMRVLLGTPGHDRTDQERRVREAMGSGLASLDVRVCGEPLFDGVEREASRQPFDLLVAAWPDRHRAPQAQRWLRTGPHHVLLLGDAQTDLGRFVLYVSAGEPAKADVRFCARLVRHLGARVEVLTVLGPESGPEDAARIDRFHRASVRTLALFGVEGLTRVERGDVHAHLRESLRAGDVLVMGAPLADPPSTIRLSGALATAIEKSRAGAILVVRAPVVELGEASAESRADPGAVAAPDDATPMTGSEP